jgi:hypothetical protein
MVQSYHFPELDTWQSPKKDVPCNSAKDSHSKKILSHPSICSTEETCPDSIGKNGRQRCC